MKAATQRPRIARSWQVACSADAAGGKWTLVKGNPIKNKAVWIGRQSSQPLLPALSNVLRSVETEKTLQENGCSSKGHAMAETLVHAEHPTRSSLAEDRGDHVLFADAELSPFRVLPDSQLRFSVSSPRSSLVTGARLIEKEENGNESSHLCTRAVRIPGFVEGQRSRISSKRCSPPRPKHKEEERRSKRRCFEASGVEKGGSSTFQTASGKGYAVTPEMKNREWAFLTEDNGLLQSVDQPLVPLQSNKAGSTFLTAQGDQAAVVLGTMHDERTLLSEQNDLQNVQTPGNCDNHRKVGATGCARDCIGGPTSSGSPAAISWGSGANCPPVGTGSLFTSCIGQKIMVSEAAIRRAEATMERGICAEIVSTKGTADPCENIWKSKISELAVREALERLEGSAIASVGDPVNDPGIRGSAPTTSSATLSDAAIRRAGVILVGASADYVQSKEITIKYEGSWKSQISGSALRKALELLESSTNARATRPPTKSAVIVGASEQMGAVARQQMRSKQNEDHQFFVDIREKDRCKRSQKFTTELEKSRANLVASPSSGHSQRALQEGLSSTGDLAPYRIQQRNKFSTSNQGCPIAAPFKPPRLLRQLKRQELKEDSTAQNPVEEVKSQGSCIVNMPSPGPEVYCPAYESLQEIVEQNARPEMPSRKLRVTLKELNIHQPGSDSTKRHLDRKVGSISAENATSFKVTSAPEDLGAEDFRSMLLKAGANSSYVTSQWVTNHYRWIIWKLASYERRFPQQAAGKYLTVQRVFIELLNRYRREYQNGHRTAVRRITERDSAASQMMVLCISSTKTPLRTNDVPDEGAHRVAKSSRSSTIELTDGWYRINAVLDQSLTELLQKGKMFVGQKLRICGAAFHGCTDGMPPLEAFSLSMLALHINGTFRTDWADTLGFCRALPIPLSLKCVKVHGGKVAATIVVVNRVYPVLFKERLKDGRSVVRSARAEDIAEGVYNSRRACIVDELELTEQGCMLPLKKEALDDGALLFAQIVASAEPEMIFANMTRAQRQSIADFQSNRQVETQMAAQKRLEQALVHADLLRRDVSPFFQIRVSEVSCKTLQEVRSEDSECAYEGTKCKEGLLTVWNPSQDQIMSIPEGVVYRISDLIALPDKSFFPSEKGLLHLRATKSSKWQELSIEAARKLQFGFTPRFASRISTLDQIQDGGEFDIACIVLHVGEVKQDGFRLCQWIFVADGPNNIDEPTNWMATPLLAIQHHASLDAFMPFESSMQGSVMGYCNLRKRRWDSENDLWVADASLISEYSSKPGTANFKHLKNSFEFVRKWATRCPSDLKLLTHKIINEVMN